VTFKEALGVALTLLLKQIIYYNDYIPESNAMKPDGLFDRM
jgi:hypothetical protein